jgi:hypothetical protein
LPCWHDGADETFALPHTFPHAPQFVGSPLVGLSHPFAGLPSQSAKPSLQSNPHAPVWQAGFAFVFASHGVHAAVAQPTFGSSFETQLPLHAFCASVHSPPDAPLLLAPLLEPLLDESSSPPHATIETKAEKAAPRRRLRTRIRREYPTRRGPESRPCGKTFRMRNIRVMSNMRELVADLEARRAKVREMGGAARVQKQHERGKMTARERLGAFFDDGV